MTGITMTVLPDFRQKEARSAGDALKGVMESLFPYNTAKQTEQHLGLSRTGAENVAKGHAGGVAITAAAKRGGWPIWLALGERLIGKSLSQYLEDVENERRRALAEIQAQRETLDALARRVEPLGSGSSARGVGASHDAGGLAQ